MEKIVGVIAEFNPFHNGHLYLLNEVRRRTKADAVVIVLSTSFMQRGTPALLDKWTRTEMALANGANLVLELPIPYCCENAGIFAYGATSILAATRTVNCLAFGMEWIPPNFQTIVSILSQEPQPFKTTLKESLDKGASYARARAEALNNIINGAGKVLQEPNNTLAIAYAESIERNHHTNIELLPIVRKGQGYRNESIDNQFASSSGIRRAIADGGKENAFAAMPKNSASILERELMAGRCVIHETKLWENIRLLLIRANAEELRQCAEMSEGLEMRLIDAGQHCDSFEELTEKASSRRHPRSRVRRTLIHFLLNLRQEENITFQKKRAGLHPAAWHG